MSEAAFFPRRALRATRFAAAAVASFIGLSASACPTTSSNPASPGQNGAASSGAGPLTSTSGGASPN